MSHFAPFFGSYKPDDVHFLLKPIVMEMTPVDLKEELIQSGKMHYSDMLSREPEPTRWHWIFSPVRLTRELHVWHWRYLILLVNWPVVLAMNPLYWSAWSELVFHWGSCCIRLCVRWENSLSTTGSALSATGVLMLRRLILSNHAMVLVA